MRCLKINKYSVKPLSSKKENISLITIIIVVLILAGFILKFRHISIYKQEIKNMEMSAFEELNGIELGIYSDLKNSAVEIFLLKNELTVFPDVSILDKEEIPPFYKDRTWKERGEFEWIDFSHDINHIYLGISNDKKFGSFFLELNPQNIEKTDIYYTKEKFSQDKIKENFSEYEILFKKVIPYTGEDERKKFKEE